MYRWEMGPTPSGPDPHFHKTISESFYILSGRIRLYDGFQWIETTPGDFLFVHEGGIHAFRNESGEPATMLILFAPGAPREDYFETLADVARREALRDEQVAADFYRHETGGREWCRDADKINRGLPRQAPLLVPPGLTLT